MRGITITERATVYGRDGGLDRGAVLAGRHRRELKEAGDTGNAEADELEEAILV